MSGPQLKNKLSSLFHWHIETGLPKTNCTQGFWPQLIPVLEDYTSWVLPCSEFKICPSLSSSFLLLPSSFKYFFLFPTDLLTWLNLSWGRILIITKIRTPLNLVSQNRRLAIKDLKNSIKISHHSNVCKTDSRIHFIFAKHLLTFEKCIF